VFAETYIESFFDNALPSLLTSKNVPGVLVDSAAEVSLIFRTTKFSLPSMAKRAKNPVPGVELFSSVDVSYLREKDRSTLASTPASQG
jgi:hypothetical protein